MQARLRGLGREIPLSARAVVGRDPRCEVVLDDTSVSRRHAQLERGPRGSYLLRDLVSANGTFVDGVRIGGDAVPVSGGNRLRFGEVELEMLAATPRQWPSRHAIAGLAAAVLLATLAAVLLRGARASPPRSVPAAGAQARVLAEAARGALAADRVEEAESLARQAVVADPLLDSARRALAQAIREREAQRVYAEALLKAQDSGEEEALHLLARVPRESRLFARARIKAKDLAGAVLRARAAACESEAEAERWGQAVSECARALDVKCQTGPIDRDPLLPLLRSAERRAGRKVPWSCPVELSALLRDIAPDAAPEPAPEAALATLYPEEAIRNAISLYARGQPSEAVRALSWQDSSPARAAADRIRRVDGRSREGQAAFVAGEVLRSDRAYQEALRADRELLPKGFESVPAKQIREAIAQNHGRLGDEQFAKGQFTSAYDEWNKALAARPDDPRLLDAVARLNEVAEGIVQDARASCADLEVAAHIASPGGRAREVAGKRVGRCR